jgi:uncharacterized membrane protein YfcA
MALGPGDYALLAAAGVAAGGVNAVAGGGSLISFPALVAVGLPPLNANVTNQVAVLPGYVGGSLAYREELGGQRRRAVVLGVTSALGALLALQPWLSRVVQPGRPHEPHPRGLHVANFLASIYGGYFGAGLGIMLLAILAVAIEDTLQRLNALKGLLSLVVGAVAAVYFAFFGPVRWEAAAVMAVASFAGGQLGVRVARRIGDRTLRLGVIVIGTGVAIWLFARL